MKRILLLSTILWAFSPAIAQTIYNINFSMPDQDVNQTLQVGSAPHHVSEIVFGAPEVVSAFGGLTNQPLRFDTVNTPSGHGYDQIQIDMWPQSSPTLDVSFDFTSLGLIGSLNNFAILFDTPSAQAVRFRNDGQIALQNPGSGLFFNGETFRVRVHIDFTLNQWSLYRDGVLLDELYIEPEDYVRSIRFSYGHVLPAPLVPDSSGVAIDNILVVVPEPSGLSALGVVAGLLMAWIRRIRIGTGSAEVVKI